MFYNLTAVACLTVALVSVGFGVSTILESAERKAEQVSQFEAKTFQASNDLKLGYRILSPPSLDAREKYPLVLFLHGAGERGNDNSKQLVHVTEELATQEMQQRYPCFVVAPQCPEGNRWVEVDWSSASHKMPAEPSIPLYATLELVTQLKADLPVDSTRVYVCGLSMGGFGTWDAIQRHPEMFAAAIPICGGGDPASAKTIAENPVWVFHGDDDGAVQVNRSREMVRALRAVNGKVIYTEYPGVGHNSWTMTAENRLVWDWLFSQAKSRD